ncbi:MAG: hypothetical protein GY749_04675 [Desulfobacteraceae bacterium]|nr:hypothetical protein [Desulfobacteraceae bacterium]
MKRFVHIVFLGPFFYLRRRWKFSTGLLLLIIILTVITQAGGIILWGSLPILDRLHIQQNTARRAIKIMCFLLLYLVSIFTVIPILAPLGGRVPLPWFATPDLPLQPANLGYCLLARNYVRPALRTVLERVARKVSGRYPGTAVMYLDGNFPFFNGFPLLPHLSHNDGKKLDLAYFYRHAGTGKTLNTTPSPIGYWAYEQPKPSEFQPCKRKKSWLRWDFDWLQPLFAFAEVDPERTKALLKELIAAGEIQKILIEPHLKFRLHVNVPKVSFQGCRAARHDDHIHIQIQ